MPILDKEVRKDLSVKLTSEQKSKGRNEQAIQKPGGRWFKTNRSTKTRRSLCYPLLQGITKKSAWPEWVRERMIGDDVKELPRFNRPLRGKGLCFKYKIYTNVFLASVRVPYFLNIQAKSKPTTAMYHLSDLELCKKRICCRCPN